MAKDEDVLLARALMQRGALTKEQVSQCLKVVDQREALQIAVPLKAVIIELGLLTEEALAGYLAPAPPAAAPGGTPAEVGGFRLIRKIGEGSLGTVWEAEQVSLAKRVAVKVLKPDLATRVDLVEGFLREARAAATLVHPNIVQAIAAGEDKGYFYFAMEYVEGRTLRDIVGQRGPLPEKEALFLARKIAEGLAAAARCGLVHRDIKPANVLVSADSAVKIADFGLAHPPSVAAPGWGTPDYMAPEQVTGQSRIDVRSDLYALGATLFFLLTGKPPFTAASVKDVMLARLSQNAPDVRTLRPDASPRTAALLARLMAREPSSRFQIPQEVIAEIAGILEAPPAPPRAAAPARAPMSAPARAPLSAPVRAPMSAPARAHSPAPAFHRPTSAHHAPRDEESDQEEAVQRPAAPAARTFTIMGIVVGIVVGVLVVMLETRQNAPQKKERIKTAFEIRERVEQQEKMRAWLREGQAKIDQDFGKAIGLLRAQTAIPPEKRMEGYQDLLARYPLARDIREASDGLESARAALKAGGAASTRPGAQAADAGAAEVRALLNQGEPYKANEKLAGLPQDAKNALGAQYQALLDECTRAVEALAKDAMAKARASAAAGKRDEARQILEAACAKVDSVTRKELLDLIDELCETNK